MQQKSTKFYQITYVANILLFKCKLQMPLWCTYRKDDDIRKLYLKQKENIAKHKYLLTYICCHFSKYLNLTWKEIANKCPNCKIAFITFFMDSQFPLHILCPCRIAFYFCLNIIFFARPWSLSHICLNCH